MNNPNLKYWPVVFLLTIVEGGIAVVWLGLIPPDIKNSVFLGYSINRVLMMAFIIVVMATSTLLGVYSWRHYGWREQWLAPYNKPVIYRWLVFVILIAAFGSELILLYLHDFDPTRLTPYYIRSLPLLGYLFLICAQFLVWLLLLHYGQDRMLIWRRVIPLIFGWVSISIALVWFFSPAGQGVVHTWWYIQTFEPLVYERHGADYCASDYWGRLEDQYQRANNIREQLVHVDRQKALLAIFNKVTHGAMTNTEKHLLLLKFIQKSSYHTPDISSYSEGQWVYDPLVLLGLGDMWCTQGAILAIDLFGAAGYPGRLVQLAHHQIAEIYYDGGWHYFDTDLFGNGGTVFDTTGNIPSVAEMSNSDSRKIDALPAFQEFSVMDCTRPDPGGYEYPSYYYFSNQAYLTDVPQGYFVSNDSLSTFEHGWKPIDEIVPNDVVVLNDLPKQHTPLKPSFTNIHFNFDYTTLTISFSATDPDNDLAGYQVFISDHSRGWDYNKFYGDESTKSFWALSSGWNPEMYEQLFDLPPSNLGLIRLDSNQELVEIPIKHGISYFITVMSFDSYGQSVGRVIYPMSNELKVTAP